MAGETYRLWPTTDGPASAAADTTGYSLSTEFEIISVAKIEGFYWWCANGADTTPKTFQVFSLTGAGTGTAVPGTLVDSGTLVQNTWNFVPLAIPVSLSVGQRYRAVVYFAGGSNWYAATGSGWTADLVNGLLSAPSTANATGNIQSGFRVATGAIDVPNSSGGSNYWVDLLVRDASLVVNLGVARTEDAATPLVRVKRFNLGVAAEMTVARAQLARKLKVMGTAATEDAARGLSWSHRYSVPRAVSQDAGRPLLAQKILHLGAAHETVSAGPVSAILGSRRLAPANVLRPGTTGPTLIATSTTGGS